MTPTTLISPELLRHLRVALLGATGIAVEDLSSFTSDLEGTAERFERPGIPSKRAAYHMLMEAVRVHYELQKMVGLPGEPLREVKRDLQEYLGLITEILTDYRDATLQLLADPELGDSARQRAVDRLSVIDPFLSEAGEVLPLRLVSADDQSDSRA